MKNNCEICKNNIPFEMPQELIEATIKGKLVLFCGAGISTENKLVLPTSFYESIKKELDEKDDSDLSFSNLMEKYCELPNGRKKLLQEIKKRFDYINSFPELQRQATDFHQELSTIFLIKTIITTNWDNYFEECCAAIPITIAKDIAFWNSEDRFVLKIHGSIQNPSTIIATTKDYKKKYKELKNGVIGATVKNILATNTVVFIGYSFRDEDFNQILKYLRKELGDVSPHIYIVTLDRSKSCKFNYDNSTIIFTSGKYFLQVLKNELIKEGILVNDGIYPKIFNALKTMEIIHKKTARINSLKYPSVIYTLAYQDGIIHSWERYLRTYNNGEYNAPGHIALLVKKYSEIVLNYEKNNNYWDSSYYEGYIQGLIYIDSCGYINDLIKIFPFMYLPKTSNTLSSFDKYIKELKNITQKSIKYNKLAKLLVSTKGGNGIVMHHPPY